VLITPHVIRSQQQALDLTEDLQEALPNAALVPGSLQSEPFEGSEDPSQAVRAKLEQ
jgi:general secretion pathway protein D